MTAYKEILRLHDLGITNSRIAESLGCSRTTVIHTLDAAAKAGVRHSNVKELSDSEIRELLHPPAEGKKTLYRMPDFEHIHREMGRTGVTLSLLWVEYCEECRLAGHVPYQSTQFYKHYADYAKKHRATMHINRKPGDIMEVDWAGKCAEVTDCVTGEVMKAYIFVAALAYSGYAYVEAFLACGETEWIAAHNHAYKFYGGVTRIVTCDNLKTGVLRNGREETIINKAYQDMAAHYDTAVIPARVRKPRDKPTAEGEVGIVSTWIVAALRNRTFFSLAELNGAIAEKLDAYNRRPFQKKEGSRFSVFLEEKAFLRPLPTHGFELATFKTAKVQDNYHIRHAGKYYSVPYEYIGRDVELRVTASCIEVLYDGARICSHMLLKEHEGKYSTAESHMPKNHQKYGEWNGDRFRNWAKKFGPATESVVEYLLSSVKVEQQSYKTCRALLHLVDKYSAKQLEAACEKVISFTPRPSLRSVDAILKSGRVCSPSGEDDVPGAVLSEHGFTRGSGYYGGDGK
jgi:transposase